jgi:hypothetical protein
MWPFSSDSLKRASWRSAALETVRFGQYDVAPAPAVVEAWHKGTLDSYREAVKRIVGDVKLRTAESHSLYADVVDMLNAVDDRVFAGMVLDGVDFLDIQWAGRDLLRLWRRVNSDQEAAHTYARVDLGMARVAMGNTMCVTPTQEDVVVRALTKCNIVAIAVLAAVMIVRA